jgi:hypothetical protein
MIVELELENFRGFDRHTLPLRPLTIMVGANNAGKSTVVEALRHVSQVQRSLERGRFTATPEWLDHPRGGAGVAPSQRLLEFDAQGLFHLYGSPPARISATFNSGASVDVFVGPGGVLHGVFLGPDGEPAGSAREARNLALPLVAAQPQVAPLLKREPERKEETIRRAIGSYLSPQHFRNQLALFPEDYPVFREIAERTWPGLLIKDFRQEDGRFALDLRIGSFVGEASRMGHGLQMWLQLMWFLARTPRGACAVLDEPDVYMHPDLQHRLFAEIRNRFDQLVVAAHSVELMSHVEPRDILIIDRDNPDTNASEFATSLPAVQAAFDQLGTVHRVMLTRLWKADRFLLVEGEDVGILRAFERSLAIDPFLDRISHGDTQGWGGWSRAVRSELPERNRSGETIITYAVFDRDYHSDAEVKKRFEEADQRGIRLHIWRRKEIENYLLVPSAIARLIANLSADGKGPEAADVETKIVELAVGLRADTELAIIEALGSVSGGPAKALQLARSWLENAFSSFEGTVALAPGKTVLSQLSSWSGERWGVTFGPLQLAYALEEDEIDDEVSLFLTAVAERRRIPRSLRP